MLFFGRQPVVPGFEAFKGEFDIVFGDVQLTDEIAICHRRGCNPHKGGS